MDWSRHRNFTRKPFQCSQRKITWPKGVECLCDIFLPVRSGLLLCQESNRFSIRGFISWFPCTLPQFLRCWHQIHSDNIKSSHATPLHAIPHGCSIFEPPIYRSLSEQVTLNYLLRPLHCLLLFHGIQPFRLRLLRIRNSPLYISSWHVSFMFLFPPA